MRLAESVAKAGAMMIREYLAELRRQGRIKGNLYVVIKEGKRSAKFPFHEF
jgi:hypothetical protein